MYANVMCYAIGCESMYLIGIKNHDIMQGLISRCHHLHIDEYSYHSHDTWVNSILICVLYILNQYSASNYVEKCISNHLRNFNATPINFETLDERRFGTRNKLVVQVGLHLDQ